jgi:hypothetical protein
MFGLRKKTEMPTAETALPGRDMQMPVPESHFVLGTPLKGPWPAHLQIAMFGLGLFLGRGTQILGLRRRAFDASRLCRWHHRQSDI